MTHTARAHARLSPSGAHRWMHCPGSIRMSVGIEDTAGIYADEGTAAHMLAEHCLARDEDPAGLKGGSVRIREGGGVFVAPAHSPENGVFAIDDDMVAAVSVFVDTVRSFAKGAEFELETKLDLRHIPGMEFGTGDALVYRSDARHLFVCDYKHGRGVPVEVENNPQLLSYALGAVKRYHNRGVDRVTLVVVQPRCPHPAGPVRSWEFDALDLIDFQMEIAAAAKAALADDAPLNPGEWCRFCPASGVCPAQREKALQVAGMEFEAEPPAVSGMSPREIAEVLREAGVLKDWIKRVEERAHKMAMDGSPPPGFKLVASRATRKWATDEHDAARRLAAAGILDVWTTPELKSPAQVEKIAGRKAFAEIEDALVKKVSSGTILVPEQDPRPPVRADAEEEFA